MQRFRSTWLALVGGALLVTFSISAAFGAAPATTRDDTRGQSIAAYVHELLFGADEEPNEDPAEDEEGSEEEATDQEEGSEEEATDAEESEEGSEDVAEEEDEADSHGECVSEVAQDKEAVGGPNENHGGAVSEAARITCWEPEEDAEESEESDASEEEASDEEEVDEATEEEDEESDSHGACVSEVARDVTIVGGFKNNHGGAVSEAARITCWEPEEDAEEESSDEASEEGAEETEATATSSTSDKKAAKEDRGRGKPSWAGNGGNGRARGGGRP